jgi:hypothetical protein
MAFWSATFALGAGVHGLGSQDSSVLPLEAMLVGWSCLVDGRVPWGEGVVNARLLMWMYSVVSGKVAGCASLGFFVSDMLYRSDVNVNGCLG